VGGESWAAVAAAKARAADTTAARVSTTRTAGTYLPVLDALRRYGLVLAIAAVVLTLADENGTFSLSTRNALAMAVWWTIVLALAIGA